MAGTRNAVVHRLESKVLFAWCIATNGIFFGEVDLV
jgi:hypothetical protein